MTVAAGSPLPPAAVLVDSVRESLIQGAPQKTRKFGTVYLKQNKSKLRCSVKQRYTLLYVSLLIW